MEELEIQTLFPGIKVGEFEIKPWTWDQFVPLLPTIGEVARIIRGAGFNKLEEIEPLFSDPQRAIELVTLIGPCVPEIISKTLGLSVEEIKEWDAFKVMNIFIVILIQNVNRLKNSLSLWMSIIPTIIPRPLPKQ